MKRILLNLAYFVVLSVVCGTISMVVGKAVQSSKTPPEDINAIAYQYLVASTQSSDLQATKLYAEQARQMATDKELQTLADIHARSAALSLNLGRTTREESKSLTGFIKSSIALNGSVSAWLDALGLAWDDFTKDPEKLSASVNNRYQQYFQQIKRAKLSGENASAYTFIALAIVAMLIRKPVLNRISKHSFASPPSQASGKIDEPLIACPECGARNRNKILSAGQKLVCGQCKTVLLNVS